MTGCESVLSLSGEVCNTGDNGGDMAQDVSFRWEETSAGYIESIGFSGDFAMLPGGECRSLTLTIEMTAGWQAVPAGTEAKVWLYAEPLNRPGHETHVRLTVIRDDCPSYTATPGATPTASPTVPSPCGRVAVLSNGDTLSDYVTAYSQYIPDGLELGLNIVDWMLEGHSGGSPAIGFDRHTWEYYFEVPQSLFRGEFDDFIGALQGRGYQVDSLDYEEYGYDPMPLTLAAMSEYDVFVMTTPMCVFSLSELLDIEAYVHSGGNILLLVTLGEEYMPWEGYNPDTLASVNQVSQLFGIFVETEAITDSSNNIDIEWQPVIYAPNWLSHSITEGIPGWNDYSSCFGLYQKVPGVYVVPPAQIIAWADADACVVREAGTQPGDLPGVLAIWDYCECIEGISR